MSKRVKKRIIERAKDLYKKDSRVVRLSPEVDKALRVLRKRHEPYDNIIRRLLGLPVNKYQEAVVKDYWVIIEGGELSRVFDNEAEANGQAVRLAVKNGLKKPFPVVKLRSAL